jgi:hypothetical protein
MASSTLDGVLPITDRAPFAERTATLGSALWADADRAAGGARRICAAATHTGAGCGGIIVTLDIVIAIDLVNADPRRFSAEPEPTP